MLKPSSGKLLTFYIYRAMAEDTYAPENINAANLPGVMWYLNNEVIITRPRKFGIKRIVRMKIQVKATQPLLDKGMNFGVRYAFDAGNCTGPYDCNEQWDRYGYFVGCNYLGDFPFPTYKVHYTNAIWYSFPGSCPSETIKTKNWACMQEAPGGACSSPTGQGNCTYSYMMAGELSVDEIERAGGPAFWANPYDDLRCSQRVALVSALFAKKYPTSPKDADLPSPPCDFDQGRFYAE